MTNYEKYRKLLAAVRECLTCECALGHHCIETLTNAREAVGDREPLWPDDPPAPAQQGAR